MQSVRFYAGGKIFHLLTIPTRSYLVYDVSDLERLCPERWDQDLPEIVERAELITVDHRVVLKWSINDE